MQEPKELRIYLDLHHIRRVEAGKHNFLGHVVAAFRARGVNVSLCPDDDAEILQSATRPGYSLFHMLPPTSPTGLTFRLAYVFPFWKIERTGTRWEFDVAEKEFNPSTINSNDARVFFERSRNRLYPWIATAKMSEDAVYIPLQGRLLQKRAHQHLSPIDMVRSTVAAFPDKPIRITLHPNETYSEREISALSAATQHHPNTIIDGASPNAILPTSKLVVTQNSSTAFTALFLKKPVVLFAKSDFHHITHNAWELGEEKAFENANNKTMRPERFLYWFLQKNTINAGRDDVQTRIVDRVQELGWKI